MEVVVLSQESEWSCISVSKGYLFFSVSTMCQFDFGNVPTVWYPLFFCWGLEMFRRCGILCFSVGFWKCSDSVVSLAFLLGFGNVPTVWYPLFFCWILEMFRQCGILCFSVGFWKCSDSVVSFVFLLGFGNVPTVW